jgi:Na+/H+ antiporter
VTTIWWALAALALILAVRVLAERLRLPAAVLLVFAGLAVAVLPVPTATLRPDLILHGVIPPLLFVAARDASLIELRGNLRLIGSLSVALVAVTALVAGAGLALVVGGLGFAAAVAIGAAMAPPDPVAALAIGRRARLPRRLTTVIEGEGLLNDATALTIYGLAVTAAVGGGFSLGEGIGRFLLAVVGGVVVGVVVARLAAWLERIDDDLVANAVSLATPFLAFAAAEEIHGSGVLAVVVAGLILGHRRLHGARGASRIQTAAVWRIVEYLLEGYVFLLIGEQVPSIVDGLSAYATETVVAAAGVSVAAVLLVRPLWLVAVGRLSGMTAIESRRDVVALSWAGTRGVITLATAFALPLDFPSRDLLLFCALVVVLVTLIGQGLTFGPLLRALGLAGSDDAGVGDRMEARVAALDAAIERLEELAADGALPASAHDRLRAQLKRQRDRAQLLMDRHEDEPEELASRREQLGLLRRELLDAQREELIRRRDAGRLSDHDLRILVKRLDLQELHEG